MSLGIGNAGSTGSAASNPTIVSGTVNRLARFTDVTTIGDSRIVNDGVRLYGATTSAPTFASGSVNSNTATINTTAAHGLVTGDFVTISGSTGVNVNGTYSITVVDTDTFSFSITVGDGTITAATITPRAVLKLGADTTSLGEVVIGSSESTKPALVLQAATSQSVPLMDLQSVSGTRYLSFGPGQNSDVPSNFQLVVNPEGANLSSLGNAANIIVYKNQYPFMVFLNSSSGLTNSDGLFIGLEDNQYGALVLKENMPLHLGSNDVQFMSLDNKKLVLRADAQCAFSSNTGNVDATPDAGLDRVTAKVTKTTDGSTGLGWHQTAGDLFVDADQTVDSTTLTNATSLVTASIATTRKIAFEAYLPFTAGDTVADGIKLDFGQGSATATYFIADAELIDGAGFATLTNPRVAGLTTAISVASTTNTNFVVKIKGALVVNGAGTFGLRFAKVSDAGTGLTLKRGAWMWLKDMP
jgi:hypothetical protein